MKAIRWLKVTITAFFTRFRKVKQVKKKSRPAVVHQKTASMLVYGFLSVFCLVGFLGSLRAIGLYSQVSSLQKQVVTFEKKVSSQSVTDNQLDVSKIGQYMSDFIKVYINFDESTSEERMKKLEEYYAFPLSNQMDTVKRSRQLTGQRMIGVTAVDDFYVADVKLSFDTVENGQTVSRVRVLAIPFQMDGGLLSIVSPPYFKQEDVLLGEADALVMKDKESVESVDETTQKSVTDFLAVFFDKYAASNEVDLSLLMKTPFYMGGQYEVDSIQDNSRLIYKEGKYVVVQVSVSFKDKGNEALHIENFTLYLINQDSGWYVDQLFHYFK